MRAAPRLVVPMLVLATLVPVTPATAAGRSYHETVGGGRDYRLLVLPVDFTQSPQKDIIPNHRSWQHYRLIRRAFFLSGFAPVSTDGTRQASGSIADFVANQLPGYRLTGTVHPYPSGSPTVDGWYQYTRNAGEANYDLNIEADWNRFYAAFVGRIGIDAAWMRANGYDALFILHGGNPAAQRNVIGYPLGVGGTGNNMPAAADTTARFDWIGTIQHEVVHLVSGHRDFYGPVWQGYTAWDILSSGNALGAFPAPMSAWLTRAAGYRRWEMTLGKNETDNVFLPQPQVGQPKEMVVLDNASVGAADDMVIEYRRRHPSDRRYDTAFNGIPEGNRSGLLVANVDSQARGSFTSYPNRNGGRSDAFTRGFEQLSNEYALAPVTEIKRADGMIDDARDLYAVGDRLPGSGGSPLAGSANPDGDVVWELDNLMNAVRKDVPGLSFDARFQGKSLAGMATAPEASWSSPAGSMGRSSVAVPEGWVYEQSVFRAAGVERPYRRNLWIATNREGTGASYSGSGKIPYRVAATGDRLTGAVYVDEGESARLNVDVETAGQPPVPMLSASFAPPNGKTPPEFSVDLTRFAGQDVMLLVSVSSATPSVTGLLASNLFRKADPLLRDFVAEQAPGNTRLGVDEPVSAPTGAIGRRPNARLEDGVVYGDSMYMRPQTVAGGRAKYSTGPFSVPSSGAVLRGSVGYLNASRGRSDGATMRLTIDDGVHRLRLREWTPPLLERGTTSVALGDTAGTNAWAAPWASGLGWGGDGRARWVRDWMRSGDFNGDGRTDVVVFTGGEAPRAGVALSTGRGFAPLTRWHSHFGLDDERPFVGRLNDDAFDDIITVTPGGDVYGATSNGRRFVGTGAVWGRGLVGPNQVPALADVDGDRLDDLVVFAKYRDRLSGPGGVWVARNVGGGFGPLVRWIEGFCGNAKIPLAGDVTGDGRADALCLHGAGSVTVSASAGTHFAPPTVGLESGGPRFSEAVPEPSFALPAPGPQPSRGSVPFLARRDGTAHLVWFDRSAFGSPSDDRPNGDVWAAPAATGRFGAPVKVQESFSADIQWPAVGDFNGDRWFDLLTTEPTVPKIEGWAESDCPAQRALCYPGDLYVSPKAVELPLFGSFAARLNRTVIDLRVYQGQTVSLDISVNGGDDPAADMIVWPDLKLYQRP